MLARENEPRTSRLPYPLTRALGDGNLRDSVAHTKALVHINPDVDEYSLSNDPADPLTDCDHGLRDNGVLIVDSY